MDELLQTHDEPSLYANINNVYAAVIYFSVTLYD